MATKEKNLLPEDTASAGAEGADFDVSNLRVNFSEEEASSEGRSFDALPGGQYLVCITDWEVRTSNSDKHKGKPYWALQLRVQEGEYENRVLFANVMLFEGALYSLAQLLKATGHGDAIASGKIPNCDELVGVPFVAIVQKKVDKYKIEQGEWDGKGPKPMKNDVSGYKPADQLKSGSGGNTLLP